MIFCEIEPIFLLLFSLCYGNPIAGGKNVGNVIWNNSRGLVTGQNKYPFMVHLTIIEENRADTGDKLEQSISDCGGVIITEKVILTAAHCLEYTVNEPTVIVHAGFVHLNYEKKHMQESHMIAYAMHKNYIGECKLSENFMEFCLNDIAVLWLQTPLVFGRNVNKAILSDPGENLTNKKGLIIGWGENEKGHIMSMLQEAEMNVISKVDCEKYHDDVVINDGMICLLSDNRKVGSCEGDSGSPLIINGKVYGISSFSAIMETSNGTVTIERCDPMFPAVYTNVGYYTNWIKKKLIQGPEKVKNCKEFEGNTLNIENGKKS